MKRMIYRMKRFIECVHQLSNDHLCRHVAVFELKLYEIRTSDNTGNKYGLQ